MPSATASPIMQASAAARARRSVSADGWAPAAALGASERDMAAWAARGARRPEWKSERLYRSLTKRSLKMNNSESTYLPERIMDLAALAIFRAVVRENGVTRAAAKLHRVQSNVTTRIKQLEEELGAALFVRDGRRLVLTPAGHTLLPYAERLLALA